jgi:hypothetical protein
MTNAKSNRATRQAKDGQVILGINKDLQTLSQIPLAGQTFTPMSLVALIQSRIDAANKVAMAKANWQDAVKAYRAINTNVTAVVHGLYTYVLNAFGMTSPQLADFGFTPPKRATQTPEEKAAAVAKRAATRKARGTKGPKAKKAITGQSVMIAQLIANQKPADSAVTPAAAPPTAPTAAPVPAGASVLAPPVAPSAAPGAPVATPSAKS